jgi:hypothetical protein
MTDNQIDMADCSNRAAERDSVSDAKMKRAELTFIFQFNPKAAPSCSRTRLQYFNHGFSQRESAAS